MFLSRNKKNTDTFWLAKVPYQELCVMGTHYVGLDKSGYQVNFFLFLHENINYVVDTG